MNINCDILTKEELKLKTRKTDFYQVYDKQVIEELIKLNKFLYYTENGKHFRTGKDCIIYYFEDYREVKKDAIKIRERLYNQNKNK